METIMTRLRRRLEAMTPAQRTALASELGISPSLIPKLVGGHRENPRVATIQPLVDYFDRLEQQHAAE